MIFRLISGIEKKRDWRKKWQIIIAGESEMHELL